MFCPYNLRIPPPGGLPSTASVPSGEPVEPAQEVLPPTGFAPVRCKRGGTNPVNPGMAGRTNPQIAAADPVIDRL